MELKNERIMIRIRGQYYAMLFAFTALIVISVIGNFFEVYILPVSKYYFVAFFAIFWITMLIIRHFLKYSFVYYSDAGKIIMLRYFHISLFNRSFKSIEVPKNALYKYEINTSFFGLKRELILYQKTSKGIAKYAPVSLSALKKSEIARIIDSLQLFTLSK